MSLLRPSAQRCKPVRLIDVPRGVRTQAAWTVLAKEDDPIERLRIMLLAYNPPPDLVAWIRP